MNIQNNVDLLNLNSFHLKVFAKRFIEIFVDYDFVELAKLYDSLQKPVYILGGGSNTLFKGNFEGTIVKISNKGITKTFENGNEVHYEVAAGENWDAFVRRCIFEGLYGVENLLDIPGQVGSSPIQNIGAYGMDVSQSIIKVKVIELSTGKDHTFKNEQCGFGYRESNFKNQWKGRFVVKSVEFKLTRNGELKTGYGDIQKCLLNKGVHNPNLEQLSDCISEIRSAKLPSPDKIGNAGSFFKNPIVDNLHLKSILTSFPYMVTYPIDSQRSKVAAGWLIENAGLKGLVIGGAKVHENQALVIINHKFATYSDIIALKDEVIKQVQIKYGITLEPEVNIV